MYLVQWFPQIMSSSETLELVSVPSMVEAQDAQFRCKFIKADSSAFSYTLTYLFKDTCLQSIASHNAHQQYSFAPILNFPLSQTLPALFKYYSSVKFIRFRTS
jgi:hypothetical protein